MDEIKQLLDEQHQAFEAFKQTNDERLQAIEQNGHAPAELEAKVDAINNELTRLGQDLAAVAKKANRPGVGADGPDPLTLEHKQALGAYLRKGEDRDLASLQRKAMATYRDPDGGYFLTEQMAADIERTATSMAALSGLAQTLAGNAAVYKKPVRTAGLSYAWRGEGESPGSTSTPTFSLLTFEAREVDAFPEVTNESLEDLGFDVEAFLTDEVALAFADAEADAFLTGDGLARPRGLLTYGAVTNAKYAWGNIGYVASGASGAFATSNPSDTLIDLVHALKAQYRAAGAFLMNDLTLAAIRKFKDAQGNYLWQPGLQAGVAGLLLGYPVRTDDHMPDVVAGSLSIAFGDFRRAYLVYRRRGLRLIRDNITHKGFTSFWVTQRLGGGVQNFEAVKLMKFAAS